jgi:hypothetical protein
VDPIPAGRPEGHKVRGGEELRRSVSEYLSLIGQYVSGQLDGHTFEMAFFALSGNDPFIRPDPVERIIEHFFFAVEDYVAEPSLQTNPEDLNDEQLRTRARQLVADLENVLAQYP